MGEFKTLTYEDLRSMYFRKEEECRRLQARIEELEEEIDDLKYNPYRRNQCLTNLREGAIIRLQNKKGGENMGLQDKYTKALARVEKTNKELGEIIAQTYNDYVIAHYEYKKVRDEMNAEIEKMKATAVNDYLLWLSKNMLTYAGLSTTELTNIMKAYVSTTMHYKGVKNA